MRKFLAAGLFLLLVGCSDKANDLFDTASCKRSRTTGRTRQNSFGRS